MIERLAWDSDFFGYEVGRLRVDPDQLDHDAIEQQAIGYDLVYVLSEAPIPGLDLVDVKVLLDRVVEPEELFPAAGPVERFTGPANEDLYLLALESGIHSRFRTDPGFHNNEFERLYRRWLDNSLERNAEMVLVLYDAEGLSGFVSLAHASGSSTIGLIAVNEHARGKGVGRALLEACFVETQRVSNNTISVMTQEPNKAAMGLYTRCGFHISERTYIHHLRPRSLSITKTIRSC